MSVGQDDPYEILGIPKHARLDEIERAFRRLAFLYHPDKRPGDPRAEDAFRRITAAYASVRKIAEEVANGMPPPPPGPETTRRPWDDAFGFEPRESSDWRAASGECGEAPPRPSGDPVVQPFYEPPLGEEPERAPEAGEPPPTKRTIRISFLEAARGGSRSLEIRHGIPLFGRRARRIEVKIPAGIANGTILRLRGGGSRSAGAARRAISS